MILRSEIVSFSKCLCCTLTSCSSGGHMAQCRWHPKRPWDRNWVSSEEGDFWQPAHHFLRLLVESASLCTASNGKVWPPGAIVHPASFLSYDQRDGKITKACFFSPKTSWVKSFDGEEICKWVQTSKLEKRGSVSPYKSNLIFIHAFYNLILFHWKYRMNEDLYIYYITSIRLFLFQTYWAEFYFYLHHHEWRVSAVFSWDKISVLETEVTPCCLKSGITTLHRAVLSMRFLQYKTK